MAQRCEDYPCCGHTDGLGCNYDTSYYQSKEYHNHINLHYGCDHEAGWCAAVPDEPTCDVCDTAESDCEDWCGNCGCCTYHCQDFEGCKHALGYCDLVDSQ